MTLCTKLNSQTLNGASLMLMPYLKLRTILNTPVADIESGSTLIQIPEYTLLYLAVAPLKRAYTLDSGVTLATEAFSYKEMAAYQLGFFLTKTRGVIIVQYIGFRAL